MPEILVLYYTRTGNTRKMAEKISLYLQQEKLTAVCKPVGEVRPDDLVRAAGIIAGSPVYYGGMAAEIKKMFDESISLHGKLDGKPGAAFATYAASGQETTLFNILQAMLVHGMIVQGDTAGHHYGVTCQGAPAEEDNLRCQRFAARFAMLVKRTG